MKHIDLRKQSMMGQRSSKLVDIPTFLAGMDTQVTARGTYHVSDTIHDLGDDNDASFNHYWNLSETHDKEYAQLRREGRVR